MHGNNIYTSTYEELWPELNSAKKVDHHISHTKYESSSSSIEANPLQKFNNSAQHCCENLRAGFEKSHLRNHSYHNDFTTTDPSASSSNIFNQPLMLANKQSRLSYTGNFSIIGNRDIDVNPNYQSFSKHATSEIREQDMLHSNQKAEPTFSYATQPSQAQFKTPNHFKNIQKKNSSPKQQIEQKKVSTATNLEVQAEKSGFSLDQAACSFPELGSLKKLKSNTDSVLKDKHNVQNLNISVNKRVSKSWKPKVKDPIFINLDQALQSLPEKNKSDTKKATQAAQQAPLPANSLDSDKPQQRKGKVRPDKPKRPSKLKERILAIRQEKGKPLDGCETKTTVSELNESVSALLLKSDSTSTEEKEVVSEINATLENCPIDFEVLDNKPSAILKDGSNEEANLVPSIHSRKFREYCTNCITEQLVLNTCALLEKVAQFQDRLFAQNPLKASAKRRYVAGIHQASKFLNVKKVKVLVIAPDLEKSPGKGGLDDKITNMIKEAESQEILCVFGPNRKRLGRTVRKNALVACIAVLNYEGAEEQFTKAYESLTAARSKYQALTQHRLSSPLPVQDENSEEISKLSVQDDSQREDVTSTLLEKLRDNISPASQLLRAINPRDWCGD